MEFKEVIGLRRSIRWFKPWQPVEREKIQVMLEAANRSSRSMNADYCKAVVVNRDDLDQETRDALRNPTTTVDLDLAPTYIFWFTDMDYEVGTQDRLKELVQHKVLPPSHGWSEAYVDEVVWGQVIEPMSKVFAIKQWMGSIESGICICNALNAAVDEGLGACLHAMGNPAVVKEVLKVPDSWFPAWLMLVGYPLEDREAGGQRPRRPLDTNFFEGTCETPFVPDPEVTERLRREGMIQEAGPFPWRADEVRMLSRMFGLPE